MAFPREFDLPEPDPDARAHSAQVASAVRQAIQRESGFLPFDRYMQLVLYAPGLGYYVAGARKFGAAGDFVTAPELTSLFGATIARQVAAILDATPEREIVELGAGSGRLAADLLNALAEVHAAPRRYRIVEVSPELVERQRAAIVRLAPAHAHRVEWLQAPPDRIAGAVIMNEVLDAVPPSIVVRAGGQWREQGVVLRDDGALTQASRPLIDTGLRALASARFPAGDYTSEINPAAEALVEDMGRRLAAGAMLVIDYGFPRAEYYHPQRADGTLMAHYRHLAHGDPLRWPGLTDLTAHVDFTAIAEAGERAGLTVAGFATQAAFLLAAGLLDRLAAVGPPDSSAYLREAAMVQTLTSSAEMGELFKVLALARSDAIAWPGFALADMTHRL
jgi:SAM-dependent MidA family methyltransferase